MNWSQKRFILYGILATILAVLILLLFYSAFLEVQPESEVSLAEETRLSEPEEELLEDVEEGEQEVFSATPPALKITHSISNDPCPNPFSGAVMLEGPSGGSWSIDEKSIPEWLVLPKIEGAFPDELADVQFNCQTEMVPKTATAQLNLQAKNEVGQAVDQLFFDIVVDLIE